MSERGAMEKGAQGTLVRRLVLARAALLWERAWPSLWPACGVVGLFLTLALLDVWRLLSGWTHVSALALFAAALAYALWRPLRGFAWPTRDEARRRLERRNGLHHRPLTLLQDRLASDPRDAGARLLWRTERGRAAAALRRLRVGIPEPNLARHDPLGLRAALGLLLVVGFAASGFEWPSRLARALTPDFTVSSAVPAELDAWISPPKYTRVAPMLLAAGSADQVLNVPAGSELLARVHGGRGVPTLRLDGKETAFDRVDERTHRIKVTIDKGTSLEVVQGGAELGAWPLEVVPDRPPRVSFAAPPSRTVRAALRVDYEAADDYGLASLTLRLHRAGSGQSLELDLPMPGVGPRRVNESSFHDLTPHPWAGLPVILELAARDGMAQEGLSERLEMVLPERIFNHPVARAIIEQRKALTVDPSQGERVAKALDALSARPAHFFDDVIVYLALRSAHFRLVYDRGEGAIAQVQELLWDTALRIEDGSLSLAERELRAIQQKLMAALAAEAPDAEIERLMDALEEALDNFLRALAEQARQQAARGELEALDPNAVLLENQDLLGLLDQAREMSRAGARGAARELLAQLQRMLENLRAGMMMGAQEPGTDRFGRALRDLGELMRRQQGLLDETFRDSRRAGDNPDPGAGQPGMAMRQEALRRGLGDIMRFLGEGEDGIPDALGWAERSMLDARRALEQGRTRNAVTSQTRALAELRSGARTLVEEMVERLRSLGEGMGALGRLRPGNRDPLGRPLPGSEWQGAVGGGRVKIPDKAELRKAREILDELYRRAGQRDRPEPELDYIDRLLRRF